MDRTRPRDIPPARREAAWRAPVGTVVYIPGYGRATIEEHQQDDRVRVRYADGSTYHVKRDQMRAEPERFDHARQRVPVACRRKARHMLDDAAAARVGAWLHKWAAGVGLGVGLRDAELSGLQQVIEAQEGSTGCCTCVRQRHESARAVLRELAQGATVLEGAAQASEREVADREQRKTELDNAMRETTARRQRASAECREAEHKFREAEEALRRARAVAADKSEAEALAMGLCERVVNEHQAAALEARTSREYNERVQSLHRLLSEARDTREAEWRDAQDRIGAPQALARLQPPELELLLVELGMCCYIEPLSRHQLGPQALHQALQGGSDAQIRRAVVGAERARFGEVRALWLALKSIDEGNGLPTEADVPRPEGPMSSWSVEAVRLWLVEQELGAAAAACAEARVSGPCLLSLEPSDIFEPSCLNLELAEGRRLQQALAALRELPAAAAAPADLERLSAAVVRALNGGEPCAFPLAYLRRCTAGFGESRLAGEGSFGAVYRAVDPVVGVRFAVKRLRGGAAARGPAARTAAERSMRREVEVLLAIHHPHMIRLLGHCAGDADGGNLCLVYEFGVHGSLADNLSGDAKAAALGWKVRMRILTGLASVLNFLHRHSEPPMYHRDVKSANVVLCEGYTPKLIDCGLAKLLSDAQAAQHQQGQSMFTMGGATGGLMGTQGYMCPSYMRTNRFGDKSEVYSFGIVVLEVLTGELNAAVNGGLYDRFFGEDEEDVEELTVAAADTRPAHEPELQPIAAALVDLATQCVVQLRQRPRMQRVLAQLRRLEQQHCQLTVEDVQSRLAALSEQAAALVEVQREEQQAAVVATRRAEAQRRAAEVAARRDCCICFDETTVAQGVECGAQPAHFVCDNCLASHALEEAQKPLAELRERNAQTFCPLRRRIGSEWQCACEQPYLQALIAAHVPPAVFEAVLHAGAQVQEERLAQQYEQRLEAERRRIEQLTADELRVVQTRRHIQECILTLKCPRCEAAFLDFDGCFALTCHRCNCGFCAYCLADCGNDAHAHVAACPHRLQEGYGGPFVQFEHAQRQRRQRMLREYLATVDVGIRARVLAACAQYIADLGLQLD